MFDTAMLLRVSDPHLGTVFFICQYLPWMKVMDKDDRWRMFMQPLKKNASSETTLFQLQTMVGFAFELGWKNFIYNERVQCLHHCLIESTTSGFIIVQNVCEMLTGIKVTFILISFKRVIQAAVFIHQS